MHGIDTACPEWELLLLDADPPVAQAGSLAAGDIDGDGHVEVLIGGASKLLWYRPDTFERGVAAEGRFHCGLALADIDGDGRLEVFAGEYLDADPQTKDSRITWFKPTADLSGLWPRHVIDPLTTGGPHDVLMADLDGDGKLELVAAAVYVQVSGLFIYRPAGDLAAPWRKHKVQEGLFGDGTAVADVDGDGYAEILGGPYLWHCPPGGPFAGPWQRTDLAVSFREMCRAAFVDVTGRGLQGRERSAPGLGASPGRPDAIVAEAEYLDGRVCWFENRVLEDPEHPWIEHPLDGGLYYAHSLRAWRDVSGAHVFLAEMAEGGWNAPRNRSARLMEYSTADGASWRREVLHRGCGTHEAILFDVNGDGQLEVLGKQWLHPKVQIWKKPPAAGLASPLTRFRHRMLDREKPDTAIDILAADVDGDGLPDVVCGGWWYQSPSWQRRELPQGFEAINAFDLDGDGRLEIVAIKRTARGYEGLTSDLHWLRPTDPIAGEWEVHPIGQGSGDWPHGSLVARLLEGGPAGAGRLALVAGYHNAGRERRFPEIFAVPNDPAESPWPRRVLAEIAYGEEFAAADINGDGRLDVVAGPWWLENAGDGSFIPRVIAEDFKVARIAAADVNGDGRPDVVAGEEVLDFQNKLAPLCRLAWFECPEDPAAGPWRMHVIDKIRCPHSLSVADLDGDGVPEIVCGEHDPFYAYRSRCRLMVYKQADPAGTAWKRYVLDDRFEHHDGAKIIRLAPGPAGTGRLSIISHGWKDSRYVHLWEPF